MQSLKCKNCNAELSVEVGNREYVFCQFCGTKLLLDDYRSSFRYIDEAKVKMVETASSQFDKKMEIYKEEKIKYEEKKEKRLKLAFLLFLFMLAEIYFDPNANRKALIGSILGIASGYIILFTLCSEPNMPEEIDNFENDGSKKLPDDVFSSYGKNYAVIKALLESAGFHNIQCVALNDITPINYISTSLSIGRREGTVADILIDGKKIEIQKRYHIDASVLITYHSKQ